MDSFEWNKIIGAVLGTAIFIFVVRLVAEKIYEPEIPAKPGYVVEGVVESPVGGGQAAPVAEVIPDWGTVLPTADVAAGKTVSVKCEQCHDLSKGGPNKIGPNLYDVVGRPRATHPGFDYSSAMKSKSDPWSYDGCSNTPKSPQSYVPGTKMTFAGTAQRTGPHQPDRLPAHQFRQPGGHPGARAAQERRARPRQQRRRRRLLPPPPEARPPAPRRHCPRQCRQCGGRQTQHRHHHQGSFARPRRSSARHQSRWQRRRNARGAAEKVRAQTGQAESPFHAAAGLGCPRQKRFQIRRFQIRARGRDTYKPEEIDYFSGFRPPPGFLKTLPKLKAVFSLGAGIDGFLRDPEFPRHIPLVRFVDSTLMHEMAQFVLMHILIVHRDQRIFDRAQPERIWAQGMLKRPSRDTRVGLLGLGDIGATIARDLLPFDFQVLGWSRSRKAIDGVKSYAGEAEFSAFLGQCDYCVCVLPLTDQTRGIMNARLFAQLPKGAWVINVARGGHLIEEDLLAALDSGHLGGAVLDVFQTEPLPKDSPIWTHPKITVTPHIAGITDPRAALAYVADCVARAESGQPLKDVIDLTKGY